jgi:hypothetical protein
MGLLQSFAGYLISWCCIMTSKRGSKSKSAEAFAREMANVSGLEVRPSRSRFLAKVLEGEACQVQPRLSQHEMKHPLLFPRAGIRSYLLKPASRVIPLCTEAGRACQECLKGPTAILAPAYRHT